MTLTESTSPSALLCGSLDAARRQAAVHGRELLGRTMAELARAREQIREIDGLDVLDDRLAGRPGVFAYDPLRLAVDVRGIAASGYELAPLLREIDDINLELYGQNVIVAVFGMAERGLPEAQRLVGALREAAQRVGLDPARRECELRRAAALGRARDESRARPISARRRSSPPSAPPGAIAAESLATYPPGIPNVLPGERLTAETLAFVRRTLEQGGSVRGASDRLLHTVRVVAEERMTL